ncbi:MAG: oxygenase MpaB family protein [Vitreimonas sp.]
MPRNLDRLLRDTITPPAGMSVVDFSAPVGAAALFAPDSVTWRVMKNPVALMVGGIAGVILELAEPRVRTGVWEHTTFRRDPAGRIRRTGYATMVTIYGPADAARALAANVSRRHAMIGGETPRGAAYRADDNELLTWVHATAAFGFLEAYCRFVHPLSGAERDRFYVEGASAASLFGVRTPPLDAPAIEDLFESMRPALERSDIMFEFLSLLKQAPLLPVFARPFQRVAIRAAIEIIPPWARDVLGLSSLRLPLGGHTAFCTLGATSERVVLETAPPAQACARLGLPANFLYR